jgi:hypothetical protein
LKPSDGLEPSTPLPVVRPPRKPARVRSAGAATLRSSGDRRHLLSVMVLEIAARARPALPGCTDREGPATR